MNRWWSIGLLLTGIVAVGPWINLGSAQPPPPPRPAEAQLETRQGRVQSFTTAPRGEVDGLMLEDGTWVHWPPHLQNRFKDIAAKGDRVRVSGWMETGPAGDTHFETQTLTKLGAEAAEDRKGAARAADRPANREQRLRDLEEQIEALRKEIRRLRQEQ